MKSFIWLTQLLAVAASALGRLGQTFAHSSDINVTQLNSVLPKVLMRSG